MSAKVGSIPSRVAELSCVEGHGVHKGSNMDLTDQGAARFTERKPIQSKVDNCPDSPYVEVIRRRLKNLNKKLQKVEKYEQLDKSTLNEDQLSVISRKSELLCIIKEVQEIFNSLVQIDQEASKKSGSKAKSGSSTEKPKPVSEGSQASVKETYTTFFEALYALNVVWPRMKTRNPGLRKEEINVLCLFENILCGKSLSSREDYVQFFHEFVNSYLNLENITSKNDFTYTDLRDAIRSVLSLEVQTNLEKNGIQNDTSPPLNDSLLKTSMTQESSNNKNTASVVDQSEASGTHADPASKSGQENPESQKLNTPSNVRDEKNPGNQAVESQYTDSKVAQTENKQMNFHYRQRPFGERPHRGRYDPRYNERRPRQPENSGNRDRLNETRGSNHSYAPRRPRPAPDGHLWTGQA